MGEMIHRQVADELKDLMVRAREGDEGALPKVREIFDEVPTLARKVIPSPWVRLGGIGRVEWRLWSFPPAQPSRRCAAPRSSAPR
jgi:hypothetical protein